MRDEIEVGRDCPCPPLMSLPQWQVLLLPLEPTPANAHSSVNRYLCVMQPCFRVTEGWKADHS
jgi:hypothetical protein